MRLKTISARHRRLLVVSVLALTLLSFTGCQTVSYYAQAVRGQCQILHRRQSCEKLIANPETPDELKAKLRLAGEICDFAERELKLPVNGHYRQYADLQRPFAVWNLYAAPEFSLEAKTWWYPIVGRLDYRGYFAEADARKYAAALEQKHFECHIEGVEAYSTLGWFKDPLLNTFIHHKELALAETLFHELAHQKVFASGDTDFNEAFATTVGQEGVRRWLQAKGESEALEKHLARFKRDAQFVQLVAETRAKLEQLFGDERTADGRIRSGKSEHNRTTQHLKLQQQLIFDQMRRDYELLKASWDGYAGYDDWFIDGPNNARLNSVATYYDLVPAFERLLAANGSDLTKFYAAARQFARVSKVERRRRLESAGVAAD